MRQTHSKETIEHALRRLAENNGNVKKTAAELKIARSVLTSWRQGTRRTRDVVATVQAGVELSQKDEYDALATKWERIAVRGTDKAEELIAGTKSFKEAVIGSAVATDKALLLRGKPTSSTHQTLRIELVAGGSLKELAEATMRRRSAHTGDVIDVPIRELPEAS